MTTETLTNQQLMTIIEGLLFVSPEAVTIDHLATVTDSQAEQVEAALQQLKESCQQRGIRLQRLGKKVQLVSAPEVTDYIERFLGLSASARLSTPALETLTIIAYRGPVSKAELEQIRGVNCSLILRNLLMRGLVEAQGEPYEPQTTFRVTMDFVRFLGVSSVEELPDYEKLRSHENIVRVLEMNAKPAEAAADAPAVGEESAAAEVRGLLQRCRHRARAHGLHARHPVRHLQRPGHALHRPRDLHGRE